MKKSDNLKNRKVLPLLTKWIKAMLLSPLSLLLYVGDIRPDMTTDNPLLSKEGQVTDNSGEETGQGDDVTPDEGDQKDDDKPDTGENNNGEIDKTKEKKVKTIIDLFKEKGVDKFTDPSKVVESYLNMEKMTSKTSQTNKQLMAEKEKIEAEKNQLLEAKKQLEEKIAQVNKDAENNKSKANTDINDEELNALIADEIITNPTGAIAKVFEKMIPSKLDEYFESKIKPTINSIQESQKPLIGLKDEINNSKTQKSISKAVTNFVSEKDSDGNLLRPDWKELQADVQEYMKENPYLGESIQKNPSKENIEKVLDFAYNYARGKKGITRSNDDLLKDEDFINKLASNEKVQELVEKAKLNDVAKDRPPKNIKKGGTPPAAPEVKPKTLDEAKKAVKKFLGG